MIWTTAKSTEVSRPTAPVPDAGERVRARRGGSRRPRRPAAVAMVGLLRRGGRGPSPAAVRLAGGAARAAARAARSRPARSSTSSSPTETRSRPARDARPRASAASSAGRGSSTAGGRPSCGRCRARRSARGGVSASMNARPAARPPASSNASIPPPRRPELARGDRVLGMARQTRVEDASHAVLTLEPARQCRGGPRCGARRARRGSGSRAGRGTRRAGRASRRCRSGPARRRAISVADPATTPGDHVAVAAEVLRRRLDDEVGAELERPADVRARRTCCRRCSSAPWRWASVGQRRRGRPRRVVGLAIVSAYRTRVGARGERRARPRRDRSCRRSRRSTPSPPNVAEQLGRGSSRRPPRAPRSGRPPGAATASAAWIAAMPDASATPGLGAGELREGVAERAPVVGLSMRL